MKILTEVLRGVVVVVVVPAVGGSMAEEGWKAVVTVRVNSPLRYARRGVGVGVGGTGSGGGGDGGGVNWKCGVGVGVGGVSVGEAAAV